ncbi:Multidrug resistance protein MdtK [Anatilimnocola aggregata]|uniref:Multidrug-efflux transporter n=1 Tax=Anatilimnocola aggregata TaxID=2528021 RepID=A0A517YDR9_9BACT|nr:MATE family efflux transporter [Anatilimnocola aggregata]QDU28383.1 Multidrug resistance protein MdtK [Anatilimnocola aggregata]
MNATDSPPLLNSGGVLRPVLMLALPVLAEESLNLLVGLTDWYLAGNFLVGEEPLAAMGLLAYVMWLIPSFFSFVGIGATALVARFIGAGNREQALHVTRQAILLGLFLTLLVMAVCFGGGPTFIRAMNFTDLTAELAERYLVILAWAVPFIMFEQIATACLRGSGDTVSGLQARVLVNLTNCLLSAALVTGWGPFPHLGWEGLAIGTLCGHIVGATVLLVILLRGRGGIALAWQWEKFDIPTMRRILRIGLPAGFDLLAVIVCHLIYAGIIYSFGKTAQAAHGLGVQIEAMSYLAGSAFQVAAATMCGQSLGAQNPARAVRSTLVATGLAMATMCTAGFFFFTHGEQLAVIFAREPGKTTHLTGELLRIVAISCPFLAVLQVTSGALRGAGDTTWPFLTTLAGLICIRLPGAAWLGLSSIPLPFSDLEIPGFGWGAQGAWIAMVADVAVRSVLISARFAGGKWQHVNV